MTDVHVHVHHAAQAVDNLQQLAPTVGQSLADLTTGQQVLSDQIGNINPAAPDEATPEANIVQAASTIAAAFVLRNFQKRGDGRGQYSLDTIVAMSVDMAEKIHAAVHGTETD